MLVQLTSTYYLDSSLFHFCLPTCVDCQSNTSNFFPKCFFPAEHVNQQFQFLRRSGQEKKMAFRKLPQPDIVQHLLNTSHSAVKRRKRRTTPLNFRKIWGFTKFSLPDVEEGSKLGAGPRVIESQISLDLVLLVNSEENAHPLIDESTEIEYWLQYIL